MEAPENWKFLQLVHRTMPEQICAHKVREGRGVYSRKEQNPFRERSRNIVKDANRLCLDGGKSAVLYGSR